MKLHSPLKRCLEKFSYECTNLRRLQKVEFRNMDRFLISDSLIIQDARFKSKLSCWPTRDDEREYSNLLSLNHQIASFHNGTRNIKNEEEQGEAHMQRISGQPQELSTSFVIRTNDLVMFKVSDRGAESSKKKRG